MDKRAKIALIGLGAVGTAGVAYYLYKLRAAANEPSVVEMEIEQTHLDWLTEKAAAHAGGDIAAAFHQLLAHCIAASDADSGAEKIFKEIRCNTCGGKKNKTTFDATLSPKEKQFINAMVARFAIKDGVSKCVRVMFEYAINDADEASIFA